MTNLVTLSKLCGHFNYNDIFLFISKNNIGKPILINRNLKIKSIISFTISNNNYIYFLIAVVNNISKYYL